MAAAPHARKARASNRTEGTSMIADVRLFRHGASVGSRVAPHVWAFVLAGSAPRRGPATLKRALDRATRLGPPPPRGGGLSRGLAPGGARGPRRAPGPPPDR